MGVEQLEDRRLLAVLIGPADDIEALNDQAPPAGQNVGAEPTVAIENFTLNDGAGDTQDVFIYRAHSTGKLLVSSLNDGFAGFMLDVQDSSGVSLLGGPVGAGVDRSLPVVESVVYYVVASDTAMNEAGGVYSIELSNIPAPTPANVSLSPASDTGASNSDNVTSDNTPTFFIQADIAGFLPALPFGVNLGAIDSNGANGYDVELVATNLTTGAETIANATRLGASATWTATTTALPDAQYLVSARTRVDDATTAGGGGPNTGFSQLSTPIFVTIDAVADPVTGTIALTAASDSGMLNNDNVTNLPRPSFAGVGPQNAAVRLFAQPLTPGGAVMGPAVQVAIGAVGSDNTDGVANDGQGAWDLIIDPLIDGRYGISVQFETPAGLLSPMIALATNLFIDTAAPNTPFLDLTTDTGRSNVDNITASNLPTFVMRSNATVNGGSTNAFSNDVKYRLYVRPAGGIGTPETLIYDSFTDATLGGGFTTMASLTRTVSLTLNNPAGTVIPNGAHDFILEIEDRAGNISHDFLLPVTIDTVAPPVSFGLPTSAADGLHAGSDTGVATTPATFADGVTSATTPTLWGRAEADSVVQLFFDSNGSGTIEVGTDAFLGQTTAIPLDGNNAFPNGYWEITSVLDLNQLLTAPALDGVFPLLVTAQDVAGNVIPPSATNLDALSILVDTQGPRVDAVTVPAFPAYDLFDPKPSVSGPSPLINSIAIDLVDLPNRTAGFLQNAIVGGSAAAGVFQVVGDHVGIIPINTVTVAQAAPVAGGPAAATVTLTFFAPLPDDRFTLTILDSIVDAAGNRLDGESNAAQPLDDPNIGILGDTLFSGDGVSGGVFSARFTVDSRPEIGSFVAQDISLDVNGNFVWDPANAQIGNDATNVDLTFRMNVANPATGAIDPGGYGVHDLVFAGKFAPLQQLIVGNDAVFVVDISGSTSGSFGGDPVGDLNDDGSPNTILDAEIAAFIALNQSLVDRGLGNTSNVSIVTFETTSAILDLDPATAGVQVSTTPLADADANGVRDVDQALRALLDLSSTNYEAGLQDAISVLGTVGTAAGNGNVVFLSDGQPNEPNSNFATYADEVTTIRDALGMNLRAFGVGPGASLPALQAIDPAAVTFSNTNELLAAFGAAGGVAGGNPSGFDQLAVFGWSTELGGNRWLIDANSDGVINTGEGDILTLQPLVAGFNVPAAIPVAGNFDGNLANGDEIGLYYAGNWALDTNRNFVIGAGDLFINGNLLGHPIVGDFDGNGEDDLGVFNNNTWNFDLNPAGFDGNSDDAFIWGFPGVLDRPVAADFDQDGVDDVGLWVPRDSSQLPRPGAEWFILISNDPTGANRITGQINTLEHPFEPPPFGNDLYAEFGDELALPIVGNFDPPVAASSTAGPPIDPSSQEETGDFNNDGVTGGRDFLAWQRGYGMSSPTDETGLGDGDGNADGAVDGLDVAQWEANFGSELPPIAAVADFNSNGSVGSDDLAMWEDGFGSGGYDGGNFLAWQRSYEAAPAAAAASSAGESDLSGLSGLAPAIAHRATDEALAEYESAEQPAVALAPALDEQSPLDAAFASLTEDEPIAASNEAEEQSIEGLEAELLAI